MHVQRTIPNTVGAAAAALVLLLLPGRADVAAQAAATLDSAYVAWDAGRYPQALAALERVLAGPDAARHLEAIALLTGELHATTELTADGRAPRWSRDGRLIAYETGAGADVVTVIAEVGAGGAVEVARVPGSGLALSPDGQRVAYIATSDGSVTERDLRGGRERKVPTPGVERPALAYAGDGSLLVSAAAAPGRGGQPAAATQIHRVGPGGELVALTTGPGAKSDPRPLGSGRITFLIDRDAFGIADLATGATQSFRGTSPAATADGTALVFVAPEGEDGWTLQLLRTGGATPSVLKRSDVPLAAPSISPDGRRVAFQAMPREDWELYLIGADGAGEVRLTREIQHDLFPQILPDGRILAVMGEGRHRRSYLYDVLPDAGAAAQAAGEAATANASASAAAVRSFTGAALRTRLFHNNTVRTVAPEYEWVVSPDGTKVLIVAERDGDTVSPERGVYLMDLERRVGLDEVRARVAASAAAESRLRAAGDRTFAPIRAAVADAVADVSTPRIYGYEHALFQFDSKFITQPGNAKAIAYIAAMLRSWGYEPELQYFEARGYRTANVIAKLPGTVNPELIYVVSSHFDSVERGPGADDDTSGTAALLEAARVLRGRPQAATIHFAFFTGEEAGLLGSREYVRRAVAAGDRIVGALNNDMVGFANDARLDNTIRYSNDGIRDIQHAAAFLFTDLVTYDAKYYKNTDAHAYYEAYGDIVGGIGSYPILGNPHYHQTHDVLETIDHQLVAEVSKTTIGTLMLLASSPSRVQGLSLSRAEGGAAVTWTPSPETGVVEYIVAWGPEADPLRASRRVREPRATVPAAAGDVVSVKAVAASGLESWDWARQEVRM